MDNAESKPDDAGYAGGVLILKKRRRVADVIADQFAAVKHRSETCCWTQKLNREDYGVEKHWVFFLSRLRFEISRLRLRF